MLKSKERLFWQRLIAKLKRLGGGDALAASIYASAFQKTKSFTSFTEACPPIERRFLVKGMSF